MKQDIIEKVRAAGVVGAGGAGFPAHVKLDARVDTVLANGASCEPLLMSDPWLLDQEIETVISGLQCVLDCTGAEKGIICLKGKHTSAMASVIRAINGNDDKRIDLFELEDFYPAGDEHVLVRQVLGRRVPEAGIPLQVGVVVNNIESLYNIALAMADKPVTRRFLTVTGEINSPMVVDVPVGSRVSDIIDFAKGSTIDDFKVIDGGPMMGRVLTDLEQPVTKATSGIILLPSDHNIVSGKTKDPEIIKKITRTVCCQCTRCTELCPRYLLGHQLNPHRLMQVIDQDNLNHAVRREALLCSECGICEKYACPMMISPREVNAMIKKDLMSEGIRWESSGDPLVEDPFRELRQIPTNRLMQRLDVEKYNTHPAFSTIRFNPERVILRLDQHIGVPAIPVVDRGDLVNTGDLVGEIPENSLGARIHASISGTVEEVTAQTVTIKK